MSNPSNGIFMSSSFSFMKCQLSNNDISPSVDYLVATSDVRMRLLLKITGGYIENDQTKKR